MTTVQRLSVALVFLGIVIISAVATASVILAQAASVTPPWYMAFIPLLITTVATPLVLAAIKQFIPTLTSNPKWKWLLPLLALVLPGLVTQLGEVLGVWAGTSPLAYSVAGALGVWLREIVDQVLKAVKK